MDPLTDGPPGASTPGHAHGAHGPENDHDHDAHGHGHVDDEHRHDQDQDHDGHGHDHGDGVLGRLLHIVRPHSHDPAQSTDAALEASAEGIRAVKISLVVLGVTAVLQVVVVVISGSVALLADTVHNFSDALTAVPLWIAFVLARRAAPRRYTYGRAGSRTSPACSSCSMIALSAVVVRLGDACAALATPGR